MDAIEPLLARIERWLDRHAPQIRRSAKAGATDQEIAAIETKLGRAIPPSLASALRRWGADGEGGRFYGLRWIGAAEIARELDDWDEVPEDDPRMHAPPEITPGRYLRGRVPFAADGSGNFLVVDLSPGERGIEGQIINAGRDEDHLRVFAPSLESFFEWYAGELEAGRVRLGESGELRHPELAHFLDIARPPAPDPSPDPDWDALPSHAMPGLDLARIAGAEGTAARTWIGRFAAEIHLRAGVEIHALVAYRRIMELAPGDRAVVLRGLFGLLGRLETGEARTPLATPAWALLEHLADRTFVPVPGIRDLFALLADARAPDARLGAVYARGIPILVRLLMGHSGLGHDGSEGELRAAAARLRDRLPRALAQPERLDREIVRALAT